MKVTAMIKEFVELTIHAVAMLDGQVLVIVQVICFENIYVHFITIAMYFVAYNRKH